MMYVRVQDACVGELHERSRARHNSGSSRLDACAQRGSTLRVLHNWRLLVRMHHQVAGVAQQTWQTQRSRDCTCRVRRCSRKAAGLCPWRARSHAGGSRAAARSSEERERKRKWREERRARRLQQPHAHCASRRAARTQPRWRWRSPHARAARKAPLHWPYAPQPPPYWPCCGCCCCCGAPGGAACA